MEESNSTAWRQALSDDWDQIRARTDWMGIPQMHDYVVEVMTGKTKEQVGDWIDHSLKNHLLPMLELVTRDDSQSNERGISADLFVNSRLLRGIRDSLRFGQEGPKRLKSGLSLVSFGCGTGHIERTFLDRGWPIQRIVCREYDRELLNRAEENLNHLELSKSFELFDFNSPETNGFEKFDVAFFCHSMHHCTDIERFLTYLNSILNDHGVILGLDYFGPPRLQAAYETKKLMEEIFASLPEHLRANISKDGKVEREFDVPLIEECKDGDPSEAPRSADLRTLLFATFPVIEVLPMGGTLLRPLLAHRAGNFRSDSDFCILRLISLIERELIRTRGIQSDNLYFVLGRSNRLPVK